ncbi:MAG: type II secretion system protein [Planctomycetota bacterium]|jgi:general secretion pathway protein G
MKAKNGFTLVEILIVVVILGILAAIVIPQFTDASTQAMTSSLKSDLQMLRSQIELYKVQHKDSPPTLANFQAQMTGLTDVDGAAAPVGAVAGDPGIKGPYMQKIPVNPFNEVLAADGFSGAVSGDGTTGNDGGSWEYDETEGDIWADDSEDSDGVAGLDHINL